MALASWCPRCSAPVSGGADDGFSCDNHGRVTPLWRPVQVDYAAYCEVLALADGLPAYVPWPLSPGWRVADFACVADGTAPGLATVSTTVGSSTLDGDVAVTIVSEEPGVGLGARIARIGEHDPATAVGRGAPAVRLRVDQHPVSMWQAPSGDADDVLARAVFVGEAGGRWLWLVMAPASAALLLRDEWLLADAGGFGPEAVEIPFGGRPPAW